MMYCRRRYSTDEAIRNGRFCVCRTGRAKTQWGGEGDWEFAITAPFEIPSIEIRDLRFVYPKYDRRSIDNIGLSAESFDTLVSRVQRWVLDFGCANLGTREVWRSAFKILGWIAVWLMLDARALTAQPIPRTILVISEASIGGAFYPAIILSLRAAAIKNDAPGVLVFSENLGIGQFNDAHYQDSLRAFLATKYKKGSIGVIVALGSSALEYVLRERATLWPGTPVVFTFVEQAFAHRLALPPDVVGHTGAVKFHEMLQSARAVVPNLDRVVIVGERLENQVAYRYLKDEIPATNSGGIKIDDLTGISMRETRQRVANLSDQSAIIYTAMYSDGEGNVYTPSEALARIAEVANRPIVVGLETYLGRGGVGGKVVTPSKLGTDAASLVLRILDGENPSSVSVTENESAKYVFDWRQLQRWNVEAARLPVGSEIRFRPPTVWEQYGWRIAVVIAAMLVQALLITGLLYEHRRRSIAEAESLRRVSELAHMNRVATAGELSATIAHELKQPLTAIISNGSAGLRWLGRQVPDLEQAQAALKRIVNEGDRANRIIDEIRAMFRKDTHVRELVDISELVRETLSLVESEIQKHEIILQKALAGNPSSSALIDRVQIQQVVLNLIVNAVEAMKGSTADYRLLQILVSADEDRAVLITVKDTGAGIDAGNMDKIFDSFFTTKPNGMGLGLSICRSIVEAHGGRLWATANVPHGAIFNIWLPANK